MSTNPDITLIAGKCWWCGAPADSREHRLKASDLKREYGKPPYTNLRTLTPFSGEDRHSFSGPNSTLVKFTASLCKQCNGARSQPFDYAWDTFVTYIADHETEIASAREIDWAAVFGADWQARGADVERYILKHAICRLIDQAPHPIVVAGEYIDFLNGGARAAMDIDLAIDPGVLGMLRATRANPPLEEPQAADAGFLGTTALFVGTDPNDSERWTTPQAGLYYRYIAVFWRLGVNDATSPFGRQVVALGTTHAMFGPGFADVFGTGPVATLRRLGRRARRAFRPSS